MAKVSVLVNFYSRKGRKAKALKYEKHSAVFAKNLCPLCVLSGVRSYDLTLTQLEICRVERAYCTIKEVKLSSLISLRDFLNHSISGLQKLRHVIP